MDEDITLLSGSSLSREQRASAPRSTDVFLISEPGLNRPDAFFYQSKHLTYDTVRNSMYQDISAGLRLGTMAFQDESKYALAQHDHFPRYVKAEFKPSYMRDYSIPETQDTVIVVGHIMINGRPHDICIPKIRQEDVRPPEKPIGLLKFLALPRLRDINENAADFNGWTYPDGRLVSKSRFPNAYAAFGNQFGEETDTQFRLPDVRDFIELNPYIQPDNATERKNSVTGLPKHNHSITDIEVNGSIEFDLLIKGYNTWDQKDGKPPEYKYHHGAKDDKSGSYVSPKIQFKADNITLTMDGVLPNQEKTGENRPSYDLLPVLMYIGKPAT